MLNLITDNGNKVKLQDDGLVVGDTYPIRGFLKDTCNGKWDKGRQGWVVDWSLLNEMLDFDNEIGIRIDDNPQSNPYNLEKNFGWCNRCHSYCYGDCTAN